MHTAHLVNLRGELPDPPLEGGVSGLQLCHAAGHPLHPGPHLLHLLTKGGNTALVGVYPYFIGDTPHKDFAGRPDIRKI